MTYTPYKDRVLNEKEIVKVHRNLNKPGVTFSLSQKINGSWLVVGHTQDVTLRDCIFKISEANRLRAVASGVKNVHAWVVGYVSKEITNNKQFLYPLYYNMSKGYFHTRDNFPLVGCKLFQVSEKGALIFL